MAKKAATPKLSDAEQVEQWMKTSTYPLKEEIEGIRTLIKKVDKGINERIKWNAPSYYFMEEDIVTFGPDRKGRLLLVMHHPLIVKIKSDLLEGAFKDRRLIYFENAEAVKSGKKELTRIVKELVTEISKKKV